jgi:hypothetical protein
LPRLTATVPAERVAEYPERAEGCVQALAKAASMVNNANQFPVRVGIGPPPKMMQLIQSFLDTESSVIRRLDLGKGFIIFYTQTKSEETAR